MEFLDEFREIEKEIEKESKTLAFPEESILEKSPETYTSPLSDSKLATVRDTDITSIIPSNNPKNLLKHWLKLNEEKKKKLVIDHWQLHTGTTRGLSDADYDTILRIHRFLTNTLNEMDEDDAEFKKMYGGLSDQLSNGGVWTFIVAVEESLKNLTIANLWHNRYIFGLLDKNQAHSRLSHPHSLILRFSIYYQCLCVTYRSNDSLYQTRYFKDGTKSFDFSDWEEYTIIDSSSIFTPLSTTVEKCSTIETTIERVGAYQGWIEHNSYQPVYDFMEAGIQAGYHPFSPRFFEQKHDQKHDQEQGEQEDEQEPGSRWTSSQPGLPSLSGCVSSFSPVSRASSDSTISTISSAASSDTPDSSTLSPQSTAMREFPILEKEAEYDIPPQSLSSTGEDTRKYELPSTHTPTLEDHNASRPGEISAYSLLPSVHSLSPTNIESSTGYIGFDSGYFDGYIDGSADFF